MHTSLYLIGYTVELQWRYLVVFYYLTTINVEKIRVQDMLPLSLIKCEINHIRNTISLTHKIATRPGAYTDGLKLLEKVYQLTLAVNVITDHLIDGQILPVVKADTQKCTAWNLAILNLKEKNFILVNIKGFYYVESMLRVHEKGHLNQNTLLFMRPRHPPSMQPGCQGMYIVQVPIIDDDLEVYQSKR